MNPMYAEQVLSYPSTGASGAKDVKGPSPEEFGGVLSTRHERRRVRPRASVDTFLGIVALVFSLALHFFWRWKTKGWTQPWGGWDDVDTANREKR